MKNLIRVLGRIDAFLTAIIKWLTIALTLAISLIITANILLRYVPITTFPWSDEIVEACFAYIVFLGSAAVWMTKGHFSVGDWLSKRIKGERARQVNQLAIELVTLAFACLFFRYSLELTLRAQEATSVFQIPKKYIYACMPASALIMIAYSLVYVAKACIGAADPKALAELEAKPEGEKAGSE